ncbi:MAG TPA: hypothetical protein VMK83_08040 [Gaiellaceae bacterium]|nr:hypothetical protein [Gaiellaceae bacterium]
MTSLSEISLLRASPPAENALDEVSVGPAIGTWAPVEMPRARRPSPLVLTVFALLAGIGAMTLGAAAVVSATRSADDDIAVAPSARVVTSTPMVEQRVLALLAKPSTDRIVFRGTRGRLVLAVGSGGRAAILVRGFERAPAGRPYYAWVIRSGKPVRVARFTGAERAVFLSAGVGRGESVVVATERAIALRPSAARIVAVRA